MYGVEIDEKLVEGLDLDAGFLGCYMESYSKYFVDHI